MILDYNSSVTQMNHRFVSFRKMPVKNTFTLNDTKSNAEQKKQLQKLIVK